MKRKLSMVLLVVVLITGLVLPSVLFPLPASAAETFTVYKVIPPGGPDEFFTFKAYHDRNANFIFDPWEIDYFGGEVTFNTSVTNSGTIAVPWYGNYFVREFLMPGSAYQQPPDQYVINVQHGGKSVTFNNEVQTQLTGELIILKQDGSGNALAGATFVITPDPRSPLPGSGSLTVADNGPNDADPDNGEFLVTGCTIGLEVTVTETVAPPDYDPAPPQTVTISASVTLTFENTPKPGELIIRKVSSGTGAYLGGATFVITPNPKTGSGSLTVTDNVLNDEDSTVGVLKVTGCTIGLEVTVTETVAPPGYNPAPPQTVTISATVTLTFRDTPKEQGGTPGFWSSPAAVSQYGKAQLAAWFSQIVVASAWFEDTLDDGNTNADYNAMVGILKNVGASNYTGAVNQFRAQYLATRLNVLAGRLSLSGSHDISGISSGPVTAVAVFGGNPRTVAQIIATIESLSIGDIFSAPPDRDTVLVMKSVCDRLNNP